MTATSLLRDSLTAKKMIVAPGAYDSLSAKIAQAAGFPAVYLTGFGATATRLAQPDIGLLTQTEMTEHARNMVRAIEIPVIADADTGYGGVANIYRTVREYLQAGVAAIHLEDQVAPKKCGLMDGVRLMSVAESAKRIEAAVESRGSGDMFIIARTDALRAQGLPEAIERARRYQDTGADFVFVDGTTTRKQIEQIAAEISGPKVVSIMDGGDSALFSRAELSDLGFSIVLYPVTALFTAAFAVRKAFDTLAATGLAPSTAEQLPYKDFNRLVNIEKFDTLENTYAV